MREQRLEAFPPDPITLADFIGHISEKGRSSATIRRAIAGISTIFRLNRMPDPSKDPEVIIAMKRMHRKLGRASFQAQAITAVVLERFLATIDNSDRGMRDRALLLIAYDTLCRRSELVSLQIQDVKTVEKDGKEHTTKPLSEIPFSAPNADGPDPTNITSNCFSSIHEFLEQGIVECCG